MKRIFPFAVCLMAGTAPLVTLAPATAAPAAPTPTRILVNPLLIPIEGVRADQLQDTFNNPRGAERGHEAIDILAPKGTAVHAVADGRVAKLFTSRQGGLTVYQYDTSEKFAYYYAHLDHYEAGLTEGTMLRRGDLIGAVGVSGNANPATPHLHFAVFLLGDEKKWWQGSPINPYPLMGGGRPH